MSSTVFFISGYHVCHIYWDMFIAVYFKLMVAKAPTHSKITFMFLSLFSLILLCVCFVCTLVYYCNYTWPSYFWILIFIIFFSSLNFFIKFIMVTLINNIKQVSSIKSFNTSSVYCIVCLPLKLKYPFVTMYFIPLPFAHLPFPLVTTVLLSVSMRVGLFISCVAFSFIFLIWVKSYGFWPFLSDLFL